MSRISAEQRREDFVNAAVRVVATHGAAGSTTRLIADEADAPLASLHYCYDSKEALLDAVFEALARRPYEAVTPPTGAGLAGIASLVLNGALDWYVAHPDWARARLELSPGTASPDHIARGAPARRCAQQRQRLRHG